MPTRELIHVSFGSLPAHLSAQYFNTQTGYFNYSPSAPQPLVDHDVSWQEGVDGRGQERYTPRWLVYDVKGGFEGLRRDEVYDVDEDDVHEEDEGEGTSAAPTQFTTSWRGPAEVVRTHGKKRYATPFESLVHRERKGEDVDWDAELEREMASSDEEDNVRAEGSGRQAEGPREQPPTTSRRRRARPWSSRLLCSLHPRSLVPVTASGGLSLHSMSADVHDGTEAPEGVEVFESFEQGWSRAKEWERDNDTLDTSLRFLLEASDSPQGFNLMHQSTDAWSGFSHWNLEQLVDEYPKLDKLVWSLRWGAGMGDVSFDDENDAEMRAARIRSMNEALSLVMMGEGSSLFTPMNLPEWPTEGESRPAWANHLRSDRRKKLYSTESYWTSLLASHFETATLGMRLRDSPVSASSLSAHLNWRGDTKFAQLGGCTPIPLLAEAQKPLDPIEALLASRGYNPRPGQPRNSRFDPAEIGRAGAKEIVKAWTIFSAAPTPLKGQKRKASTSSSSSSSAAPRPFALQAVARDAQEGARAITEASAQEWIAGEGEGSMGLAEPLGRSLFAPLDQPVPASTSAMYEGLTSSGRPWSGATSSSHRPKSLPLLSSLSTTPSSQTHIKHAIESLTTALRSHVHLSAYGLVGSSSAPRSGGGGVSSGQAANDEIEGVIGGRDGIKELLERAEEMRAAYDDGADAENDDEDGRGTDEEWGDEEQAGGDDDLDWD